MEVTVKRPLVAGSGNTRAFGGSTVATLLQAAAPAAGDGQRLHSVHVHFLAPADPDATTTTTVRTLRRTSSFTTVGVDATQGRSLVASGSASFHRDHPGLEHAATTDPPTWTPEQSPPASGGPVPPETAPSRRGFDLRAADPSPVPGPDGRPVLRYWVRSREPGGSLLDHAVALAWVSDLCLTRVADLEREQVAGVRVAASLDHALWFHRPVDLGRWLLYETSSPAFAGGLALSTGRFHADGVLVASVAQQSMLRRVTPT